MATLVESAAMDEETCKVVDDVAAGIDRDLAAFSDKKATSAPAISSSTDASVETTTASAAATCIRTFSKWSCHF